MDKRIRCGKVFSRKSDAGKYEPTNNETPEGLKIAKLFEVVDSAGKSHFVWSWNSGAATATVARHCGFVCSTEGRKRGRKALPPLPEEPVAKVKKASKKKVAKAAKAKKEVPAAEPETATPTSGD